MLLVGAILYKSRISPLRSSLSEAPPSLTQTPEMSAPSYRYCRECDAERSFEKPEVDHRAHLVATLLTAGLWGVGWLAMTLHAATSRWKCRACKSREQDDRDRLSLIGRGMSRTGNRPPGRFYLEGGVGGGGFAARCKGNVRQGGSSSNSLIDFTGIFTSPEGEAMTGQTLGITAVLDPVEGCCHRADGSAPRDVCPPEFGPWPKSMLWMDSIRGEIGPSSLSIVSVPSRASLISPAATSPFVKAIAGAAPLPPRGNIAAPGCDADV